MKCPKCGGNAELSNWGSYIDPDYADYHVECEKCGYHSMGSTDPQKAKEMFEKGMGMHYTNGQWLRQCNTEQLAEFIVDAMVFYDGNRHAFVTEALEMAKKKNVNIACDSIYEDVIEWLKQPHKEQQWTLLT